MIIVSDTTPLHHLILIDEVDILPQLLGEIIVPDTVFRELQAENTPIKIKDYLLQQPNWLKVLPAPQIIDRQLDDIDPGERAAILLAEELGATGIIIDDLAGRKIALDRGLRVLGTLGLLEAAGKNGLLDLNDALDRIIAGGFYISRALENELRGRNR